MAAINLNLRGALIQPNRDSGINYYLLLIDFPTDKFDINDFHIVIPEAGSNSTMITYTYDGTLPPSQTSENHSEYATYGLMYTLQTGMSLDGADSILITDSSPDANTVSGDPNRLHPPIVEYTYTDQVKCSPLIIQSLSHSDNYFVVVLIYLALNDGMGYENVLDIGLDPSNPKEVLQCTVRSLDYPTGNVAAIGFHASSRFGEWRRVNALLPNGGIEGETVINYIPSL